MSYLTNQYIYDYFKARPQLQPPPESVLGFEIPSEWADLVSGLIAIAEKPSNTQMHMDAALCGECTKIGRNGEHSWHCRKCGKELHQ